MMNKAGTEGKSLVSGGRLFHRRCVRVQLVGSWDDFGGESLWSGTVRAR